MINGRLIVELFMFFICNTVFLIQNVMKRCRVWSKKSGRKATGNERLFLLGLIVEERAETGLDLKAEDQDFTATHCLRVWTCTVTIPEVSFN